jgi:hypothetical protein
MASHDMFNHVQVHWFPSCKCHGATECWGLCKHWHAMKTRLPPLIPKEMKEGNSHRIRMGKLAWSMGSAADCPCLLWEVRVRVVSSQHRFSDYLLYYVVFFFEPDSIVTCCDNRAESQGWSWCAHFWFLQLCCGGLLIQSQRTAGTNQTKVSAPSWRGRVSLKLAKAKREHRTEDYGDFSDLWQGSTGQVRPRKLGKGRERRTKWNWFSRLLRVRSIEKWIPVGGSI